MKFLVLALILAIAGCAMPPAGKRIDVEIENKTKRAVNLRMRAGFFSRVITLGPGETWRGWVDPRFAGKEAVIVIEDK